MNSADSANRLIGVKSLLERLAKDSKKAVTDEDMDVDVLDVDEVGLFVICLSARMSDFSFFHQLGSSAKDNLLPRLNDTYLPILDAIYSAPSTLFATIPEPTTILNAVCSAVSQESLPKAIIRRHLRFLAGPFASKYPQLSNEVIQRAFFNLLLISKPQQVIAGHAWEVLGSSELSRAGILHGVAQGVVEALSNVGESKHEKQTEINAAVVEKIAGAFSCFFLKTLCALRSDSLLSSFALDKQNSQHHQVQC